MAPVIPHRCTPHPGSAAPAPLSLLAVPCLLTWPPFRHWSRPAPSRPAETGSPPSWGPLAPSALQRASSLFLDRESPWALCKQRARDWEVSRGTWPFPQPLSLASFSRTSEGPGACPQPGVPAVCVLGPQAAPSHTIPIGPNSSPRFPPQAGRHRPLCIPGLRTPGPGPGAHPCMYLSAIWLLKMAASSEFPSSPVSSRFFCCLGSTNQLQGSLCHWLSLSLGQERAPKINLGSASFPRALIPTLVAEYYGGLIVCLYWPLGTLSPVVFLWLEEEGVSIFLIAKNKAEL